MKMQADYYVTEVAATAKCAVVGFIDFSSVIQCITLLGRGQT